MTNEIFSDTKVIFAFAGGADLRFEMQRIGTRFDPRCGLPTIRLAREHRP
jgi:hypothetical protein